VIRSLYVCGAGFTFTPACALSDNPPAGEGWIAARVVRPALQRSYAIATPADRAPDPAAQVVARALVRQAARLIAEGRWEAELLAEVEPEA